MDKFYKALLTIAFFSINLFVAAQSSSFTVNNYSQCINGNSFAFTNTSFGDSLSYSWTFGDGDTSTQKDPVKVYTTAGDYNVTLIATQAGIDHYSNQTVHVNPLPVVAFYYIANTQNGGSYTFISTSTISSGSMSYLWSFGDGNTATSSNPVDSYQPGTYNVKLIVTSNAGCIDSVAQSLVVTSGTALGNHPTAEFAANNSAQCILNNSFIFNNSSSSGNGEGYYWDFGDGNYSILQNPLHSYSLAGNYLVKLYTYRNADTAYVSHSVTVYPEPANVDFSTLQSTNAGFSYTFLSSASVSFGSISYAWSFGDNTSANYSNPTKTYSSPGTYSVKMIVYGQGGCADSITKSVTICPKATAALSVAPVNGKVCANDNAYSFTNTSSNNAGLTMTYSWSLGDGVTTPAFEPANHSYLVSGFDTIRLIATVTDGACVSSDTAKQVIFVNPVPVPVYVLYLDTRFTNIDSMWRCFHPGIDFSYISNSTVARGQMNYAWSFGTHAIHYRDGDSTYINPRIIFDTAGTYPVKLVVTSDMGCKDSLIKTVLLSDPHAHFNYNVDFGGDVYANPLITLTNTSYDYGGTLVAWNWSYGDGNNSILENPASFHYTKGGNYSVSLNITSNVGCTNGLSQTVPVAIKPKASFTLGTAVYSPNSYAAPSVLFTNTTTVNETPKTLSYAWNFGDGQTSVSTNPNHVYHSGGTFTVRLIVTNNNGGKKDTAFTTLIVKIKPKANFTSSANYHSDVYSIPSIDFSNTTLVNDNAASLQYSWDFGDGSPTSSLQNPSHTYSLGGNYTVTLTVTNANGGLVDVITHNVTVVINPHAIIGVHHDLINIPVPGYTLPIDVYTIKSLSTIAAGSITSYHWTIFEVYQGGAPTLYFDTTVTDATYEMILRISNAYLTDYRYNIDLVVTSDLGITEATSASIGNVSLGFTPFKVIPGGGQPVRTFGIVGLNNTPTAIQLKGFTIYPNPAKSFINISFTPTNTDYIYVRVFDQSGRLLKLQKETAQKTLQQNIKVDVSQLISGLYYVEVIDANGTRIGYSTISKAN